jgi:DNA-binding transcriptional MerR regulator
MSETTRSRGYQIHEFAKLTGLTVRALQHYDHLGLLKPVRSRAGHRTYSDQDLQALVQILALKSVGVPLRQIAALRRSGGPGLAKALHMQRAVLERRKPLLDKAITIIHNVELALENGEEADPAVLRTLIEVVGPQEDLSAAVDDDPVRDAAAPAPRTPDRAELRRRWQQLLDEVDQVAGRDPASPEAQAMADRWVAMLEELAGSAAAIDAQLVKSAGVLSGRVVPPGGSASDRAWEFVGRALAARSREAALASPEAGSVRPPPLQSGS